MKKTNLTLTLGQATSILAVLQRITTSATAARYAFIISRNLAALSANPDVVAADQTRVKLIQKHGEQTPTGWTVPQDKFLDYLAEFGEVANNRTEVSLILMPLEALDSFPAISAQDMSVLDPMWESPEPVEERKDNGASNASSILCNR